MIPRTLVSVGFVPSSGASWESEQSFILLKWNSWSSPFKMKGFISIHKKKEEKKKKEGRERKLPLTNGKNNPLLCLLAKGPICGPGCEREGERFSWKAAPPPTHICVSLRLTQGPHHRPAHHSGDCSHHQHPDSREGWGTRILSPLLKDKA